MVLVSSSTNSGTPSVLTRICSSRSAGSALPPARLDTIALLCARASFERFSDKTCPGPDQRSDRFFRLPLRGHGQWPVALLAGNGQDRGDKVDVLERGGLLAPEPRIEQVAEGVADQVERQHRQQDGEPGERRDPRVALDVLAAPAQDIPPTRRGRRDAEPEERQAGLGPDGGRD